MRSIGIIITPMFAIRPFAMDVVFTATLVEVLLVGAVLVVLQVFQESQVTNCGPRSPPETIAVMTAAFDRVCQSLSRGMNDNDDVRRAVALVILRHVDQGESDPVRLSDVAFRELPGFDRSAYGDRSATG